MENAASPFAHAVIGCAIEVHWELGPGLLESAYGHCLAYELSRTGISFLREYQLPIRYKDTLVNCGYRIDFLIEDSLLLEIKSVDALTGIHQAQVLTYLKLSGIQHGLLINFNARLLKHGIKSLLLRRDPSRPRWVGQGKSGSL